MGGGYFREHDRNKKQILIIGYYGSYNFGDELMLKLLLEEFSSSETEISVVFTKNKGYDYSQWENIFAYTAPDNPIELEKATDFLMKSYWVVEHISMIERAIHCDLFLILSSK